MAPDECPDPPEVCGVCHVCQKHRLDHPDSFPCKVTYRDVENLPPDHPLSIEFDRQVAALEELLGTTQGASMYNLDDEESMDYFNRYIAGDKK